MAEQQPMFKLTVEERAQLGSELAQLENDLVAAELRKKDAVKAMNDEIEGIRERIGKVAGTINDSEETPAP